MPFFKRRDDSPKPQRDGPEQWAAKAREVDDEVRRQREADREAERVEMEEAQLRRATEAVGELAVGSGEKTEPHLPVAATKTAEVLDKPESRMEFFPIEVLNEEFLRHFAERRGFLEGKFVRVGDTIFVSNNISTVHRDIFEFAQEAMAGHELEDTGEQLLDLVPKGSGWVDAGKYDFFFSSGDTPKQDGAIWQFSIYDKSGTYGQADQENRVRTIEIAAQVLGEHIRTVEGLR